MADRLTNSRPSSRTFPSTLPASPSRRHRRRGVLDNTTWRLTSELLGCVAYASRRFPRAADLHWIVEGKDVLVDGGDGLYIICFPSEFPQKGGQDEKRTISRFVGSDRPAGGARPGPRASRGDPVWDGQTDHTSGNRNGIQICQSPSPSVFRSEGRGGQPGGMGCRVGRTAVPVVQLRLESECLEGRRLDHHYGGASQRRPKDASHS